MSTGFADERLSAYVDGELDAAERKRLELELERDPELRAEVEALQATQSLLQRHGPAVAPTDFRVRVLEAVADEPVSAPWWAWLRRPFGLPSEGLLVAAVAVAVLWVAIPEPPAPVAESTDLGAARLDWETKKASPSPDDAGLADEAPAVAEEAEPAPVTPRPKAPIATKKMEKLPTKSAEATKAPPEPPKQAPAGSADAAEPKKLVGGHRFRIETSEPDAQFVLQRIAAQYQSVATTLQGERLAGTEFANGGDLQVVVQLPHSALCNFEEDLAELGVVSTEFDKSLFNTSTIPVTIHLQLDTKPTSRGRKPGVDEAAVE